jgi:ethanolamine utilization protein EutQ
MPTLIPQATRIQSAGNKPKLIDEYIGRVNTKTSAASVAHMRSPAGWLEPTLDVSAGQAVIVHAGEWIRYSTPNEGGAEYIAVCLPAFSMESVHRDER